jgi:hypothetical protein
MLKVKKIFFAIFIMVTLVSCFYRKINIGLIAILVPLFSPYRVFGLPILNSDNFDRPRIFELKIGDVICFK